MRRFCFALFATAFSLSGFAAAVLKEESCPDGQKHYRAAVRHIESGGIGYERGYTTLEVFLASDPSQWKVTPFLDARGHVFDNGKWAANAGIGLRALWGDRVYGVNAYYDYRSTGRLKANQIGAGLETLGELFDFRINGYLPLGTKTSNPYDPVFGAFSGHYLLLSQKMQSAMKGANAEFGFHLGAFKSLAFYAGTGPYYFIGKKAPATWGGKARISGTFRDLLAIEISDSYDRTFHNKFQAQIALSFSFGPKSKVKDEGRTCQVASALNSRILQPVDRQEIIVIDNTKTNTVAINPATGLPYFFVFVDNTSSSDGTYESPYHTFAQAQSNSSPNDVIYVFPGDGTTAGMNAGISLKENQKFWGSGVSHSLSTTVGPISLPAQSSTSPTITNTDVDTLGNAVTLAPNNAISGFTITSALNDAIIGTDLQSLDVSSCTFESMTTYPIEATFSGDASVSITNNQFLNNANGILLTLNGASTVACSGNTFAHQTSVSSIPITISASGNTLTANIENNLFNDNNIGSILFYLTSVSRANLNVLNNTLTNNRAGFASGLGSTLVLALSPGTTTDSCSLVVKGNTFSGNTQNALYLHTDAAFTTLDITASANTISGGASGISLHTPVTNTLTFLATDNTLTGCGDNGIAVAAPSGTTTTGTLTISDNTFTNTTIEGIVVNQSFTNLNWVVSNNEINTCGGSGIVSYASDPGISSLTVNISDNTITDCSNSNADSASGISLAQYINLAGSITNNTLSGNLNPSVALGSDLMSPTVCLTLNGNDNTGGEYSLSNPPHGTFRLTPCDVETGANTGTFLPPTGTIDTVQSCSDPVICP
jgi:hypothetical protein